jgi:hypothetical protein
MPALTRAQFESVLILRRGPMIVGCCMSANPGADPSPRAYLGDPIATALECLGFQVQDPTNPADPEVAPVSNGRPRRQAFDLAELRLIESVIGNFSQVTYRSGSEGQDLTDFRKDAQAQLEWKRLQVHQDYPELEIGGGKTK